MKSTSAEREKLELNLKMDWPLSPDLFGMGDIYTFETSDYTYFLDNVRFLEDLLRGLRQLSPLLDDALGVAEYMNQQNFYDFKIALAYERRQEDSKMPKRYLPLLLPQRLMYALPLSDKCKAPLGTALIRLVESEIDL